MGAGVVGVVVEVGVGSGVEVGAVGLTVNVIFKTIFSFGLRLNV